MSTLSDYNNNPGNLRPPKGVTYEGQIGVDDKGFAIFENKKYGQTALINDVTRKLEKGVDTPEKFVNKFSPAGSENDEDSRENYKIYLAQQLGLKSTSDPFPKDAAERLAKAVGAFEGGTWANPQGEEEKPAEAAPEPAGEDGNTVAPKGSSDIPGKAESDKPFFGIVGGVTGAGIAGNVEAGKRILPLIPNLINKVTGKEIDVNKPASRMALQNWLNSMLQSNGQNVKLPVSELEKLTGTKIRTMGELGDAYKAIQAVEEQKVTKPMVKMVEGRPGVFEQTGRMTSSTIPGKPAVDLTPYEVKSTGPVRQALGRQMQTTGEVMRSALPSVGRVGIGALGGANAMMTGYDAWEMAQKLKAEKDPSWVDYARLATKSMATVGGGLSMLPFGITQGAGLALQAPEAAISLGENIYGGAKELGKRRKEATKEDTDRMLMNVDPMGNPMP
jgi:hypothetical protein